jgi:hypothetical protein
MPKQNFLAIASVTATLSVSLLAAFATACSSNPGPSPAPSTTAAPWVGTYSCTEALTTAFAAQKTTASSDFQNELQITASGNTLSGEITATTKLPDGGAGASFDVCNLTASAGSAGAATIVAPMPVDDAGNAAVPCLVAVESDAGALCAFLSITAGSFTESAGGVQGTIEYICTSGGRDSAVTGPDANFSGTGQMTVTCTKE